MPRPYLVPGPKGKRRENTSYKTMDQILHDAAIGRNSHQSFQIFRSLLISHASLVPQLLPSSAACAPRSMLRLGSFYTVSGSLTVESCLLISTLVSVGTDSCKSMYMMIRLYHEMQHARARATWDVLRECDAIVNGLATDRCCANSQVQPLTMCFSRCPGHPRMVCLSGRTRTRQKTKPNTDGDTASEKRWLSP